MTSTHWFIAVALEEEEEEEEESGFICFGLVCGCTQLASLLAQTCVCYKEEEEEEEEEDQERKA